MASWQDILQRLHTRLGPLGLDIVHPLAVGWYNDAVDAVYALPDLGSGQHLAVIIGNSRALWAPFLEAVKAQPLLRANPNPLDSYVSQVVDDALAAEGLAGEVRHYWEAPPRRVAMQRLAHVAGLAWLGPAHLSIHPQYGPWLALRTVVVLAVPGPQGAPPEPAPACELCESSCLPALQTALASTSGGPSRQRIAARAAPWIALRDACPVGREHRYSEGQLRYHYEHILELE